MARPAGVGRWCAVVGTSAWDAKSPRSDDNSGRREPFGSPIVFGDVPCMFYAAPMSKPPVNSPAPATLSLRIGRWFEANATGWGVLCVPLVILMLLMAALVRLWGG